MRERKRERRWIERSPKDGGKKLPVVDGGERRSEDWRPAGT